MCVCAHQGTRPPQDIKNDRLDFTIPYEYEGTTHNYIPDYLLHLRLTKSSELNVILEVKGFESEQDRTKRAAAQRWVDAVNYHGGFGRWAIAECRSPYTLPKILERLKNRPDLVEKFEDYLREKFSMTKQESAELLALLDQIVLESKPVEEESAAIA